MLNGIMLKSLPVDWVKIKKENNFVYIYARNGIKDNASFATLRNEAIKNGVFWGAYAEFNMDWSVAQAPDKQARELAFLLQGNPGDLIPAFHLIPQNSMPTRDLILGWLEVLNSSFNQYFKKIPMFGTNPNTIKYLQPIPNSLLKVVLCGLCTGIRKIRITHPGRLGVSIRLALMDYDSMAQSLNCCIGQKQIKRLHLHNLPWSSRQRMTKRKQTQVQD